ncbi:DUF4426 domain-containing protein [Alkalimonas amylolytica]|uniref:DUF4426 domain-containing protein n=1 Tax=Alkalimonas amylolytica TaxID=152573 RepID=A0A1H4E045_ALKAM|nr:DUF4426 domain-containing protein [Alkalimonas amylolytica]SEA78394.1 protein of unknown function [Alkalimonas amylolytica]
MKINNTMRTLWISVLQKHTFYRNRVSPARLGMSLFVLIAVLVGCGQPEPRLDVTEESAAVGQPVEEQRPLGHVVEFDGYTLRANVIGTGELDESMARRYGIEQAADLAMLNLVILDTRSEQQPATVWGEVTVQHQSLIGHVSTVEMRPVEADGYVSFVGTLDTSSERIFQFEVQVIPAGSDKPLQMNFEVRLD